jgi:hypothetical protein
MNLPFNRSGTQEMRVRKQVYELTLQDLSAFPIWEFRLDSDHDEGRDESTVGPYPKVGVLNPTDRMFVVRTIFALADGSQMQGYVSPPGRGEEGLGALQPIIVTERGQVRFWCGRTAPGPKRLAQCYEWLGKSALEIFPAQFKSDVELMGGPLIGIVPGFLVLEDFQTRRTRTVI